MDKAIAIQFAHQILSSDQPELLAAFVAEFSSAANQEEPSPIAKDENTPAIQQHQMPQYDAIFTPTLCDYQLVLLRNVLASLLPTLHYAPRPERTLFSTGLEVLYRQAPQLAAELHPLVQEAIRTRDSTGMEKFIRFINQ